MATLPAATFNDKERFFLGVEKSATGGAPGATGSMSAARRAR